LESQLTAVLNRSSRSWSSTAVVVVSTAALPLLCFLSFFCFLLAEGSQPVVEAAAVEVEASGTTSPTATFLDFFLDASLAMVADEV
jgi:hypothetical protein